MAVAMAAQQPSPAQDPFIGLSDLIAPVRLEMAFGVGPDGRPVCRIAVNGQERGPEGGDNLTCALFMGSDGGERLRQIPSGVALTASITLALDGEELPPRSLVDRGELVFDSSARLRVGRDGRVSNCEALGEHLRGALERMQGTADPDMPRLCEIPGLNVQRMFRAAPDGPASRAGLLRMELFLRVETSRSTV
jgi:hypothetical protein